MKPLFCILIFIILTGGIVTSCKDDPYPDVSSAITFSESTVKVASKGRYCSVTVSAPDSVAVSCSANWIQLESTTVENDGLMVFYVMENENENGRETTIQVTTFKTPAATTELIVTQSGVVYDGGNGIASKSLSKDFRVGWGYNICMDFMSDKSVTEQILDYDKLIAIEREYGDPIVDESNRSVEQMDTYTAYSLAEMARQLTSVQDSESSFLGLAKTVSRHVKISKTNSRESQVYGYVRASKIIATRYIDEGKLDDLIRDGSDIFKEEFNTLRLKVQESPTSRNAKTLIDRYGTHIVVLADIGGAIDYSINFKAAKVTDLERTVTSRAQYVLGRKKSDKNTEKEALAQSSIVNSELAIMVMGGDSTIMKELKNSISQLNEYSQINGDLLSRWMNSLDVDYRNEKSCKNLTVVKCKTLPIWDLFTDEGVRRILKEEVMERAAKSSVTWNAEDNDILKELDIEIDDKMLSFDSSHTSSLVKVGYVGKEPKIEICNEYVSSIRNDERVSIVYPIHSGVSNIRRGIFMGNGKGNPPAYVTCTPEGKAYIRPIKGYGPTQQLKRVYYLGGAIYPEPNGVTSKAVSLILEAAKITIVGVNTISYPIVKIGNGYWTRTYLKSKMGFGKEIIPGDPKSGYYYHERIINDVLYANYFYGNDENYISKNLFGSTDGLWYLPNRDDLVNLLTTIGNNPKALFMGQVSGFDAEFKGYYGIYDIHSGLSRNNYELLYGDFSFIGFKDNVTDGEVLAIGADYELKQLPSKTSHKNEYPIRLFRKSSYVYPNKK